MSKRIVIGLALTGCLICMAGPAFGISGAQWKEKPTAEKEAFVMGVVDGWAVILRLTEEEQNAGSNPSLTDKTIDNVALCIQKRKMPYSQIETVVEKYLDKHSKEMNRDMASIVFAAVYSDCNKKQ